MTTRSFKVSFYETEVYEGKRGTTYTVRWSVNGRRHGETYKTSPLAESFRATLLVAANNGEPFDVETGRPVSHATPAAETTWYEFALQYVDMKWARISANNRKNTAKALTKVTMALLRTEPKQFARSTCARPYASTPSTSSAATKPRRRSARSCPGSGATPSP
ncbi:hypothetical protein [Streptomyces klenkii]|uniref:hypothetical protein n=1 Tax=Streptomyces klenkii TaxID=1420899 RepID=UPI00343333B6